MKFCNAISIAEGYGKPGPTQHANNPGNLSDDGDVGCGCVTTSGPCGAKITIYKTREDGWRALTRKVSRMLWGNSKVYLLDMTIAEVAIKWCGDPNWGLNVARELKVPVNTTLRELVANDSDSQDAKWPNA